eukprot:gnl/MRDRNA2_/MRDRNA2_638566_c0_seq1.p2 gnl/MRDRNA2_/MRDRNA2_638566_c0~~gnl/MRDRNA2_/MRDRNA2_638566_c0_seq1.p2  ORF type:complete len:124 (-),score=19.70 gnl/MRDRNA2_/MRDRNA2_638566_c0_seq1:148-519(-)
MCAKREKVVIASVSLAPCLAWAVGLPAILLLTKFKPEKSESQEPPEGPGNPKRPENLIEPAKPADRERLESPDGQEALEDLKGLGGLDSLRMPWLSTRPWSGTEQKMHAAKTLTIPMRPIAAF